MLRLLHALPLALRPVAAVMLHCIWRGHMSTGTMLTNTCDYCLGTFKPARPSRWMGDTKITRSR